ncbi:unnamed protein product [Rangifer tarandus platyrhynchus]|uniref:Uncharacterized protein n=1 Tax=Rangifer tarandus platyrhynchus TaxID=3082113 RepID=A0AC59YQ31_RANTA
MSGARFTGGDLSEVTEGRRGCGSRLFKPAGTGRAPTACAAGCWGRAGTRKGDRRRPGPSPRSREDTPRPRRGRALARGREPRSYRRKQLCQDFLRRAGPLARPWLPPS